MSYVIAVAGKGGTGKTTLTSLVVRYLLEQGQGPVLAVDADPNSNLPEALGVAPPMSIADVLNDIVRNPDVVPEGMTKRDYIELRLEDTLAEGQDVDLLIMGGPEGQGCYCFPNSVLKDISQRLTRNYPYVVVDNEAGLEHLSRRTTDQVDLLLVVSDASVRGVRSAGRVTHLVRELGLSVKEMHLVVTRLDGEPEGILAQEIRNTGIPVGGFLPYDPRVVEYDVAGRPLRELPADSAVVRSVEELCRRLIPLAKGVVR